MGIISVLLEDGQQARRTYFVMPSAISLNVVSSYVDGSTYRCIKELSLTTLAQRRFNLGMGHGLPHPKPTMEDDVQL